MLFTEIVSTIRDTLSNRTSVHLQHPAFKASAVLVPIIDDGGSAALVFTVRSTQLKKHTGEISFPGGAFDMYKDETLFDTVLREASEEIDLKPDQVTILGELDDFGTVSGYILHPIVASVTPPYDFSPNEGEVVEIFTVPVDFFQDPANFSERDTIVGKLQYPVYSFQYSQYNIWGATAYVVVQLLYFGLGNTLPAKLWQRLSPEQLVSLRGKVQPPSRDSINNGGKFLDES